MAVSGCGETKSYSNEPRPPKQLIISAAIANGRVAISPRNFGAGPALLVISNQSDSTHPFTMTSSDEPGTEIVGMATQATAPIKPGNVASLSVDLHEGRYKAAFGEQINPAIIQVGPERASSSQDLLLP